METQDGKAATLSLDLEILRAWAGDSSAFWGLEEPNNDKSAFPNAYAKTLAFERSHETNVVRLRFASMFYFDLMKKLNPGVENPRGHHIRRIAEELITVRAAIDDKVLSNIRNWIQVGRRYNRYTEWCTAGMIIALPSKLGSYL